MRRLPDRVNGSSKKLTISTFLSASESTCAPSKNVITKKRFIGTYQYDKDPVLVSANRPHRSYDKNRDPKRVIRVD